MENLSEATLAYAAGLVDGEGTITMSRHNAKDKFRVPVISMSSTTLELVEFMKITFGGSVSSHKTYQSHHKPSYSWKLVNDGALKVISLILPYLREPEKRRRASLLTNNYKSTTPRNGKYNSDKLAAKMDLERQFFHPSTPLAKTSGVPMSL